MKRFVVIAGILLSLLGPTLAADRVQITVLRLLPRDGETEHGWVGTALADIVAGALATRDGITVVERERVAALLAELDLGEKGVTDAPAAGRVARIAAADRAVLGSFAVEAGVVKAEASLVDASTGKVLHVARASGRLADLPRVAALLADRLLGNPSPGPSTPVQPLPVGSMAEYYGGLRAEERGDYPGAFLHLARAARTDRPHPEAGPALARLFGRIGEPRHAVAEWRRIARGARGERAVDALLFAARILTRDLGDPAAAAAIYEDLRTSRPDHRNAWQYFTQGCRLRADAGEVDDAVATLAAEHARLVEKMQAVEQGPGRPREKHGRIQMLRTPAAQILGAWQEIWIRGHLAGKTPSDPPPDVLVLSADRPSVELTDGGRKRILAPHGLALRGATVELTVTGPPKNAWDVIQVDVGPWGAWEAHGHLDVQPGNAEPKHRLEVGFPASVPLAVLTASGQRSMSLRATFDLAPEGDDAWPPRPAGGVLAADGIRGAARHPRISTDADGRVHVVFAGGSKFMFAPGGPHPTPKTRVDLLIVTSEDGGKSFSPPRRLSVSSERYDVAPHLQHGADGLCRLVWLSDRAEPGVLKVWYSESRDLVRWTYPRVVPVPWHIPHGYSHGNVAEFPVIRQDRRGRIHLLALHKWGSEGEGLYHMGSDDGLVWDAPVLVAAGERAHCSAIDGAGRLVVTSRKRGAAVEVHRSPDGRTWATTPAEGSLPNPHTGRMDRPLFVLTEADEVVLIESLENEGARHLREKAWPSVVRIGPRVALAARCPYFDERDGCVIVFPVEVPK